MTTDVMVRTLVDALAERLQAQVVSGDLPPGSRVTEQADAAQYDVARPTAKAAIERDVQSGVLRRSANKTARVPELTAAEIEDVYRTRLFFERALVKVLATRGIVPEDARGALYDMQRSVESGQMAAAVDADVRFHLSLVAASGSVRSTRMYQTLVGEVRLCMAQERTTPRFEPFPNVDDHAEILEAIVSGDAPRAQDLIQSHFVNAVDRILGHRLDLTGWV